MQFVLIFTIAALVWGGLMYVAFVWWPERRK